MEDAMAQAILSQMILQGEFPGPRSMGLDQGGTNNNLTINGTMTPTASPYAGYLLKSMSRINLDRVLFPKIYKPTNTKCQVDVLGASVRANTATGGGADYVTLDASASAVDDTYNGKTIILKTGTGIGQTRIITDYVGSTKRAYVTGVSWTTQPISGTTFEIFDTIVSNVPPGFYLQSIPYTDYPTINILCSLEKQTGASVSPSMGVPIVTSIQKDWVSQAPVFLKNSTISYATALSTTGISRLDGVNVNYSGLAGSGVPILRITVDGVVVFNELYTGEANQGATSACAFLPFNIVANSTLLVEMRASVVSTNPLINVSYSK